MNKKWLVISTGFALFSMFFGSGNLVFPIDVGQGCQGHYLFAALGIFFSCVAVPFLGVFGMMLHKGSLESFFGCFGKRGAFFFSLLALALIGPFGVIARCLTVVHGTMLLLLPNVSLSLVSFVMCLIIFGLAMNKNKVISILGDLLTPLLLAAILVIVIFALSQGAIMPPETLGGLEVLKNGFLEGYQMMDLLAAFFFSRFLIEHLYRNMDNNLAIKVFWRSSLVGATILSLVYFALVLMGWIYAPLLAKIPPQERLGAVALQALGSYAAPCVCLAVIFACLTTAIALTSLFSEFLTKEVLRGKIGNTTGLLITLVISFLVSTLEFAGIAAFLKLIVEMVYPPLIALTILNVANHYLGINWKNLIKTNTK